MVEVEVEFVVVVLVVQEHRITMAAIAIEEERRGRTQLLLRWLHCVSFTFIIII